jgi:hypothetical protein
MNFQKRFGQRESGGPIIVGTKISAVIRDRNIGSTATKDARLGSLVNAEALLDNAESFASFYDYQSCFELGAPNPHSRCRE